MVISSIELFSIVFGLTTAPPIGTSPFSLTSAAAVGFCISVENAPAMRFFISTFDASTLAARSSKMSSHLLRVNQQSSLQILKISFEVIALWKSALLYCYSQLIKLFQYEARSVHVPQSITSNDQLIRYPLEIKLSDLNVRFLNYPD
ncbi:hypothetical protein FGO68_gene14831 [Halteria grandinella]|uniref:Uncharacterized protein n=1 Tax=Halteria grandinella TaxID=5974 RepID=A0A8J8P552_HALGN|nr:hypothetical protein FGO68_gene14831 [Halteria grandinella]